MKKRIVIVSDATTDDISVTVDGEKLGGENEKISNVGFGFSRPFKSQYGNYEGNVYFSVRLTRQEGDVTHERILRIENDKNGPVLMDEHNFKGAVKVKHFEDKEEPEDTKDDDE